MLCPLGPVKESFFLPLSLIFRALLFSQFVFKPRASYRPDGRRFFPLSFSFSDFSSCSLLSIRLYAAPLRPGERRLFFFLSDFSGSCIHVAPLRPGERGFFLSHFFLFIYLFSQCVFTSHLLGPMKEFFSFL